MAVYTISELTDQTQIRSYLNQDADYAAYALGDLDLPYAENAVWIAATDSRTIHALALNYQGLNPEALFIMGEPDAIRGLLMDGVGPSRVYYAAKPEQETLLAEVYDLHEVHHMYRMRVTGNTFQLSQRKAPVTKLDLEYVPAIEALQHRAAFADNRALHDIAFASAMLDDGYYRGIIDQNGCLIAVAGTHIVARQSKIAAVGNVVTDPEHRRQGLATEVSGAVTDALIQDGYSLIVLNVRQDNLAAISTYKKLGYEITGKFIEGLAERRSIDKFGAV